MAAGTTLPSKLTRNYYDFRSVHSAGHTTGGLLVLVRKSWAADAVITQLTILPGRILALRFHWSSGALLTVVVCHITAERDRTWRAMAALLTDYLSKVRTPCVVAGDYNILTDPEDILTYTGQHKPVPNTAEVRWWTKHMQRFMCASAPWTFCHKATSTYRTLDRFYLNASRAVCHLLGLHVRAFGDNHAPLGSGDHWPITLHWQPSTTSTSSSTSSGRLAPHVHKHPSWKATIEHYLDHIATELPWREKRAQMQLAFADAVEEITRLPTLDTSTCHTAYWSAVWAMRCFQQLGPLHLQRLLERCKGWEHITTLSTARQLSAFCAVMTDSLEQLLQEELVMPEEEWDNGQRNSFLTKTLTAWKSRRMLGSPSIEGANCLHEEVAILTAHWGPIFGCEANIREDAWPQFEGLVPLLPWPKVRCDVSEIAALLQEAFWDIMQGGLTPRSWHDSQLVLLPKEEATTLPASKFRPLALANTLGKDVFQAFHTAQR
eukprot:4998258-Amphidinium_carterae.2